jgi:alpha-L-rhamnosidase
MTKLRMKSLSLALLAASCLTTAFSSAAYADALADGFQTPPNSARPRVWWHWMNGNVTVDGIEKDLAWMDRIGIGGLQNFDANLSTPQVVQKRLVYMDPNWKVAFKRAVEIADQKGLEFAIAASPGWSETGGPWVKPAEGMKKLVWSEMSLPGGKRFTGRLAPAPNITGPWQNTKLVDFIAMMGGGKPVEPPRSTGEVAVIAVPKARSFGLPKAVSTDGAALDWAKLTDADEETGAEVPTGNSENPGGLVITYPKPVTARSLSFYLPHAKPPFGSSLFAPVLEAEIDGAWRKLGALVLGEAATTLNFPAITTSRFRILMARNTAPGRVGLGDGADGAQVWDMFAQKIPASIKVGEVRLSGDARLNAGEAKAGFDIVTDYHAIADAATTPGLLPAQMINLTSRMQADGTLDWTPPKGSDWRVYRFGWSLTGKTNHPATPEATGLEVDKYDAVAVRKYIEHYLGMYRDTVGPELIGKRGIRALLTDSIEVGFANWTPRMAEEFKARRGYDLLPWLPALAGEVVGSPAQSEKFLYDFRQTLADLLTDAHYGTIAKVAHENGLKVYGEALEDVRPLLGDDMAMRKYADIPMAALWTWKRGAEARPTLIGDMKGAASVAHIYGQNIVAAESMTSANAPWAFAPHDLKRVIDLEFAMGINRPVIHTSVHQPLDDKQPGFALMIFGQYFNRHDSWASMAKPWVDYIARSGFMLQQGRNYADIAWFYGEEAPLTALFAQKTIADLPRAFAYDFVNADVLKNVLSVEGKELVAKSGARYKALYLGGSSKVMTLGTLKRIAAIAAAGVPIIGEKPVRSPALMDDAAEFAALANSVWTRPNVTISRDPDDAMANLGISADFTYEAATAGAEILFVHRKLADGEVYFINNRRNQAETIKAHFRVTGKVPELWDAISGATTRLPYTQDNGLTSIDMKLVAEDAKFIVFRKPVTVAKTLATTGEVALRETALGGPWTVTFQPGRGAPASVMMKTLQPINTHSDAGIKYFSGIATYSRSFSLPAGAKAGAPFWLDLGAVGDVAEVRVNGKDAGSLWFAPWRLDIGKHLKIGQNTLEIRVANTWVNRLIGDKQPGATPITFAAAPTYNADAPLRPSGLIGPVRFHY